MERLYTSHSTNNLLQSRKQHLIRSTGSFSTIEDNIVVPTPFRKINSYLCSPSTLRRQATHARKSSVEEESVFGEAGLEIQKILLQQAALSKQSSAETLPINQVLVEGVQPIRIASPVRPSNPAIVSSPSGFNLEDLRASMKPSREPITTTNTATAINYTNSNANRIYQASNVRSRGVNHSKKELNRARSMSWPGIPKDLHQAEVAAH